MTRRSPLPFIVAGLALGAGCIGSEGGRPLDGERLDEGATEFDAQTGSIRGTVTDDSLAPIAGVDVVLPDLDLRSTTDEAGRFRFARLAPGSVRVAADAVGFSDVVRDVEVFAGQFVEVHLRLLPEGQQAQYYETYVQTAFVGCSFNGKHPGDPNGTGSFFAACGVAYYAGLYDVDRFRLDWGLGPLDNVTGLWVESTWHTTQALGSGLFVWWNGARSESDFRDILSLTGDNPLRGKIEGDVLRENQGTPHAFCSNPECTITSFHYQWADTLGPSYPADAGATIQQRVDDYVSVFHFGALPDDFSVLPD